MIKIIVFNILLCWVATSFAQQIMYVDANELNIRKGEGTQFSVVAKAKNGDQVSLISIKGEWSKIQTQGGVTGYVNTDYLTLSDPDETNKSAHDDGSDMALLWIILFIFILWVISKVSENVSWFGKPKPKKIKKAKPLKLYMCYGCRAVVKDTSTPLIGGCVNSRSHKFRELGLVGENSYKCRRCSIVVKTTREPLNANDCIRENGNPFHQWEPFGK